jgi:hypothetical protein
MLSYFKVFWLLAGDDLAADLVAQGASCLVAADSTTMTRNTLHAML